MIKKITLALLFTIPSLSFAIDLEGYYITAKGGASKTSDTGETSFILYNGASRALQNDDLGTGSAFGFSLGKYLTDSFRLELEAIKRTGYEYDGRAIPFPTFTYNTKIQTESLFINGFYDFQPFTMSNTAITPYLGGGMGISRNKSINLFGFEDQGFIYPANQSQNYLDGAVKFFKGPFFLSIDKQNNSNPTINVGFNYWVK